MEAALRLTLEQSDSKNASCFMNMVNTYFTVISPGSDGSEESTTRHLLADEPCIIDSPLWKSTAFWSNTVFEVASRTAKYSASVVFELRERSE